RCVMAAYGIPKGIGGRSSGSGQAGRTTECCGPDRTAQKAGEELSQPRARSADGFLGYQDRRDLTVPDLEAHLQRLHIGEIRLAPREFIEIRQLIESRAYANSDIRSEVPGKHLKL